MAIAVVTKWLLYGYCTATAAAAMPCDQARGAGRKPTVKFEQNTIHEGEDWRLILQFSIVRIATHRNISKVVFCNLYIKCIIFILNMYYFYIKQIRARPEIRPGPDFPGRGRGRSRGAGAGNPYYRIP